MSALLSPDQLEAALRAVGETRYHHLHPFHQRLHSGGCTRREVQAWAANRWVYQAAIPRKDAMIVARLQDADLRRAWRTRIEDHDGSEGVPGGVERWLRLTDALGLARADVMAERYVLPGTRFAVNAYLSLVREGSVLEAVASSLTEMFSPAIIQQRVAGMLAHYDFVDREALAYFTARPAQANRDVDVALAYVRRVAVTPETQAAALHALETKCAILWAMLDALEHALLTPGRLPPGCELPGDAP